MSNDTDRSPTPDPANPLASTADLLTSTSKALRAIASALAAHHRRPRDRAQDLANLRSIADDLETFAAAVGELVASGREEG